LEFIVISEKGEVVAVAVEGEEVTERGIFCGNFLGR